MYNYIIPLTLFLGVILCLIVSAASFRKYNIKSRNNNKKLRDCPKQFTNRANTWLLSTIWWTFVDYMLIILSFSSSMMVLYINSTGIGSNIETIIYSIIAAFMTIISFALSPKKHIKAYRKAWTCIDVAIITYIFISEAEDCSDLVNALMQGEKSINSSCDVET